MEQFARRRADEIDLRFRVASGMRRQINKVFPTHFSFLFGEIALYTFIVLLFSGIYLTFFYDPSMTEIPYSGSYTPLRQVEMSRAFASTLDISVDVRGGLLIRQIHHWAALLFVAAMAVHMLRIFFTGAFRKPRETNWIIGVSLLVLGGIEGFMGYSLPDDLLSGTGIRAALSGGILSVPLIGTWLHWLVFGAEFPGNQIIPRFYTAHILIVPGIILGLIAVHLALVWYQKHTQFPGVRKTERNVAGERIVPRFAATAGAWFLIVTAVLAMMGGVFQINAIWNYGPYQPGQVSSGAQPDWYMGWTEGLLRIWPDWELYLGNYTIPAAFFPLVAMGLTLAILFAYPFIERTATGDKARHNLLQRPRDAPVRTALGAMGVTYFAVTTIGGGNDVIAYQLDISLNALTWAARIGLLVLPPIAYFSAYRLCVGLQRGDRAVLEHGIETGIVRRDRDGNFTEVHQPLAGFDEHGEPIRLDYQGAPVPKRLNELGAAGRAVPGSLLRADPPEETTALARARGERDPFESEQVRQPDDPGPSSKQR
ncbi:cytochrome b [Sciscionella sediminilitoris]|uniref:cytochrome bc1 complex cytochrome b subunit n=1 Tax=Sciscionella sediminilitoris TaxID=1445613 RepID=UPI000B1D29A8|nr:cytochrome bc complex cytochrome b subunit [Sciscionella sp. SE31]